MRAEAEFPKKLENMVGQPIYNQKDPTDVYGKIVEYNPETGVGVIEFDQEKILKSGYNPFTGEAIMISSRKAEE